jgi:hypothetical protein
MLAAFECLTEWIAFKDNAQKATGNLLVILRLSMT